MNDKRIMALAMHALSIPQGELGVFFGEMSPEDVRSVEKVLDTLAQRATWAAVYLATREMNPAAGHDLACRRANRAEQITRRALGYTHP